MPVLKTQENKIYTSIDSINKIIYPTVVSLFKVTDNLLHLANNKNLDDQLKQKIISAFPEDLVEEYQKINLIYPGLFVARSSLKNELDNALKEHKQFHVNNCNEVHHVINGSVLFGFVHSDTHQSTLLLFPGEKILIKENTEHWGNLTDDYYVSLLGYQSVDPHHLIVKKTKTPILVTF